MADDDVSAPAEREFTADQSAPAAARTFVNAVMVGLVPDAVPPTLREDIELVVSELVTNAVRAASPTVRVGVTYRQGRLLLQVQDDGTGWPEPRDAGVHDTTGRGLAIVSAVCTSWGMRLTESDRKTVWAELEIPPAH